MFRFSAFAIFLSLGISVQAQEVVMDPVIVTGSRIGQVPVEYVFTPGPALVGNPMDGIQFIVFLAAKQKAAKSLVDVRCVLPLGNDLSRVTSHNDVTERWLAAQAVFVAIDLSSAPADIKGAVLGKVVNPSDGKVYQAFKVTYADNGTEKWMIFPTKASAVKLFDTPVPGSMEYGDGVPVKSPACGQG